MLTGCMGNSNIQRIAIDRRAIAVTILARILNFSHLKSVIDTFFTPKTDMDTPCKHPKVRVVAREEDTEFVECQECGEVFDSDEFRDMAIEEAPEEAEDN
jgi:hypothetical protein